MKHNAPAAPGPLSEQRVDHLHVVLVEPGDSLNIGSVARSMSNLGFTHLHLVAPPRYDPQKAETTACWGAPLLATAQIHDTLEDALTNMEQVVGFTARHGKDRPRHLLLPDWVAQMAPLPPRQTALLFGAEDTGLKNEVLPHCHYLIRIPTTTANPSFNLGQAVMLALYELTRTQWADLPREERQLATDQDFLQLERLVENVLQRAGFYHKGTPQPLPQVVKHLLRRIDPEQREMQILLGMFGKVDRALQGRVPTRPLSVEDNPEEPNDVEVSE